MRSAVLMSALLPALLSGCANLVTPPPAPTSEGITFCAGAVPLTMHTSTTLVDEDASQIINHNCKGIRWCGWPEKGLQCEN